MARLIRLVCLLAIFGSGATAIRAQGNTDDEARRPRFLVASAAHVTPVRATPAQVPALRRRLSLSLEGATLGQALAAIAKQAGLRLMYSDAVIPERRMVQLKAESITLAAALTEVLLDTDVDVVFEQGERAMLVRRGTPGLAASGSIVGRVTDAKTGLAVSGAEVMLDRTRWHALTDTGGRYNLAAVDAGQFTLTVRRFGYTKQDRAVTVQDNATDTVDVALDPAPSRLNDLVSTATGRQRRLYITNDITTINADSVVKNQPITSVTDLLEYRVPGLTVQRTSGAPGDPARLRLRGSGSPLHSNDPIVIVDGIRVYAEQSAARGANLASIGYKGDTNSTFNYATPSPLDYIDPNTIETIEIVKGPSAATLYGPDAANGVIVITTKKGHAGPTRWSFIADHGTSRTPGSFPDLTLRWGHLQYVNDAPVQCTRSNTVGGGSFNTGQPCIADSVVSYQILNDPDLTVLDRGNRNALSMTAQGGTSALTYAVTGSFEHMEGLFKLPSNEVDRYQSLHDNQLPPDWMQRPQNLNQWGVVGRFGVRLGSTANLELSSNFSHTNQQRSSLERQLGSLLTTYYDRASGVYYTADVINAGITSNSGSILSNYYQRATSGAAQFTNGLGLRWQPLPWFTVNGDAGLNVDQRDDEVLIPRGAVPGSYGIYGQSFDSAGSLNNGHGTSVVSTVNAYGTATIPIGLGLRLDFSSGVNYTGRSISDLTVNSKHLAPGTSSLGDTIINSLRNQENSATFGWYMAQSFTHRKFSISTGLRFDGGSTYGSHVSTTGGLPKLGGSYLLSDEPWFPFKSLFQSFKVRASYGRATRQPGITERLRLYTVVSPQPVNGVPVDVVGLKTLGNTELRPERTSEFEGGFETDLLDSRLSLDFTLYRKTTDDAIINFPVPLSVYGVGNTISRNIGDIRNSGLNADATVQLIRSGPVRWGGAVRVSRNQNVVVRLGPGVEPFYIESSGGSGGLRVAPGYPLFSRWAQPILGYADANGDGALEPSEVSFGDTAVYVGRSDPNYQVDLNTDFAFARGALTLSLGAHYDDGFSQFDALSWQLSSFSAALNSGTSTLDEQAASINVGSGQTQFNFYQTVHVFRLQNIALKYRIPQSFARRMGAQELNVQVQGTNLKLWTNYRGIDPNVNAVSTGSAISDNGVLPQPRSWQVRINATY